MLDECLASLAAQTFTDFVVLIYDNASTDHTSMIAQSWVEKDPRFRYFRQPYNKGATQNFLDVLAAAETPYFLWRAYDDLSSPNFLEATYAIILRHPHAKLAVGAIKQLNMNSGKQRFYAVPNINSGPEPLRLWRALTRPHPSWFYGLWDRNSLAKEFTEAWNLYPHGWGSDHLTLLRLLVRNEIIGDNAAIFTQRIAGKPTGTGDRPRRKPVKMMLAYRRSYLASARIMLKDASLSKVQNACIAIFLPIHAGKRIYSLRRALRHYLLEKMNFT